MSGCLFQATELADLTSKISLLEDAKKKKEEEAVEWQQKVRSHLLSFLVTFFIWLQSLFHVWCGYTLSGVLTMSVSNKSDIIPVWLQPLPRDSLTFLCVSGEGWKASANFMSFLVKTQACQPRYFLFFYEQKWLMQNVAVKEILFKSEVEFLRSGETDTAK